MQERFVRTVFLDSATQVTATQAGGSPPVTLAPLPAGLETGRLNHERWCGTVDAAAWTACPGGPLASLRTPSSPETVKGILYLARNCHTRMEFPNRPSVRERERDTAGFVGPCVTRSLRPGRQWGQVGSYVTFLDTARAEGERSTPRSPATGLNFKKDQTRRRRRRRTTRRRRRR